MSLRSRLLFPRTTTVVVKVTLRGGAFRTARVPGWTRQLGYLIPLPPSLFSVGAERLSR